MSSETFFRFKRDNTFEKRKTEAARIREKYPDRVPVIVEKSPKAFIEDIDKKKYLVPADLSVGQFIYVIRRRIKLSPEKAIFIFVNGILPPTSALMSFIYEEYKDSDGFLYITYSGENTFGGGSSMPEKVILDKKEPSDRCSICHQNEKKNKVVSEAPIPLSGVQEFMDQNEIEHLHPPTTEKTFSCSNGHKWVIKDIPSKKCCQIPQVRTRVFV